MTPLITVTDHDVMYAKRRHAAVNPLDLAVPVRDVRLHDN